MPSINRLPPYVIAGAALFMLTLYHVYNIRAKNGDLERNLKVYKEALSVSKEKNKVLVKDALEKIDVKVARITELEKEGLMKHTALGEANKNLADIKSKLEKKNEEIKDLHTLAATHKREIATLSKSVSDSKNILTKLTVKTGHLMADHNKMKKENTLLQQQNEKLENDIKEQQSEKKALDDKLNALVKEKHELGLKVDDLTKKNEIIQESVRQKIKESYAAHRMKTPSRQVSKETEGGQPKLKTLQHFTEKVSKNGHEGLDNQTNDQNEVSKVMVNMVNKTDISNYSNTNVNKSISRFVVNNSEITPSPLPNVWVDKNPEIPQKNVSRTIVNNSNVTQNSPSDNTPEILQKNVSRTIVNNSDDIHKNVSKVLVENSESREKRDAMERPDAEVTVTTEKPSENLNEETNENENINRQSRREEKLTISNEDGNFEDKAANASINGESLKREKITTEEDDNFKGNEENGKIDGQSEENLNNKVRGNFERNAENENIDEQSLRGEKLSNREDDNSEGNAEDESMNENGEGLNEGEVNVSETRTAVENDALSASPKISDETLENIQT